MKEVKIEKKGTSKTMPLISAPIDPNECGEDLCLGMSNGTVFRYPQQDNTSVQYEMRILEIVVGVLSFLALLVVCNYAAKKIKSWCSERTRVTPETNTQVTVPEGTVPTKTNSEMTQHC